MPRWVVVGIGLNVNWPADLPAELAGIAVAANHVRRAAPSTASACWRELLDALDGALLVARLGRATDYRAGCATIGRDVRVELPGETLHGHARSTSTTTGTSSSTPAPACAR